MKITFLGGVGTVTGSSYLVRTNRTHILLECGLYQGKRDEAYRRNREIDVDIRRLHAVVLSHAHIDHSGNLPNLVKQGYTGPIYATHATRDLCASMLPDSGRIHEYDVAYVNKKRERKGLPPMEPLYTEGDAIHSLQRFVGLGYNHPVEIARGVRITLFDAGHILGSAMVLLETEEQGRQVRLLFSGDLGQPHLAIVRDPAPMPPADYLMIESTYGDREHEPLELTQQRMAEIVNRVVDRGGRIVIPAFAVGRTQEIVYDLHQLTYSGAIPEIPIYVDSPLAVNVTEVFRQHPECYDRETREFLHDIGQEDPFGFSRLRYIRRVEDSKALNDASNPMIIISAAGMAEAGRVQHHLKHAITDPRNAVLITGWQAPHTLGRRIADREPEVKIFGELFPLKAEVHTLFGYSAHADRSHLLNWAKPHAQHTCCTFVVHGDPGPAQALASGLQEIGFNRVKVPARGETVAL
ncbi:MAG: MBL fold metallo-hydrolase [Anaerolineae bacterium]|nr:MBL fold metallo-hydrolase [Anaerolineae bacterium]